MAEVILDEFVQETKTIHQIKCDKCGKHICDSEEYDDGWYEDPSEYEQQICVNSNWYTMRAQLCENCAKRTTESLVGMLMNFGFEKGF